jgi:hypothetical protein
VWLSHAKWDLWCGNALYPNAIAVITRNLGIYIKNPKVINYLYDFGYSLMHQDSEFHRIGLGLQNDWVFIPPWQKGKPSADFK